MISIKLLIISKQLQLCAFCVNKPLEPSVKTYVVIISTNYINMISNDVDIMTIMCFCHL